MREVHVGSGGRYPVLRSLAILYMVGALIVIVFGVWRAIRVFTEGGSYDPVLGSADSVGEKAVVALIYLAATFLTVLFIIAVAELIKLLIDIEHNTRLAAGGTTAAPVGTTTTTGSRTILEGEETAEGALLRGH